MTMSKPEAKEIVKQYLHGNLEKCGLTDPAVCEALTVPVLKLMEGAWDSGKFDKSPPEVDNNPWRGWTLHSQIVTTTEK